MKKYFKFISIIGLAAVLGTGIFIVGAYAQEGLQDFDQNTPILTDSQTETGQSGAGEAEPVTGGLVPCGPGKADPVCDVCDFFVLIDNIIDFISIKIAPYLALLLIIGGAFMMIVSGGSETQYAKGKTIITSAIVGLLIIWGSWVIIDTIMSGLTSFGSQGTAPNFIPWNTIQCQ